MTLTELCPRKSLICVSAIRRRTRSVAAVCPRQGRWKSFSIPQRAFLDIALANFGFLISRTIDALQSDGRRSGESRVFRSLSVFRFAFFAQFCVLQSAISSLRLGVNRFPRTDYCPAMYFPDSTDFFRIWQFYPNGINPHNFLLKRLRRESL